MAAENKTISDISDVVPTERGVDAAALTTFRGGGAVDTLYRPRDREELAALLRRISAGPEPFLLGGGSNTLIADGILKRPVVALGGVRGLEFDGRTVRADCGVSVGRLISEARKRGLGGLEFLSGVPALLGGALKMNAGAFGGEICDYVDEIELLTDDFSTIKRLKRQDVAFGYRKGAAGIILGAALVLKPIAPEESRRLSAGYVEERRKRQPREPSCGSVFKRADRPAGYYIERAGLKGERLGGACISPVHANFIVNTGGATTGEFLALAERAERAVKDKYGVLLEREFVLLDNGE